jgi:hypothetical protein
MCRLGRLSDAPPLPAIVFSFTIGIAPRKLCIGVLPKHQHPDVAVPHCTPAALYSDVAPEARSSFLNFGPIFDVVGHGHSRISSGRLRGHRGLLQGGDQFAQNPIRHCYTTNHNCVVPRVTGAAD